MASDNPSFHPLNPLNENSPGAFLSEPGISLRDWFAGQALAGMYANPHAGILRSDQTAAAAAYVAADAMLAARVQA